MKKQIVLVMVLLLIVTAVAYAYDDGDFQVWNTDVEELKINNNSKIAFEEEFRWGDNADEFYYHHYDAGFFYNLEKYLNIGGGYRYIYELKKGKFKPEYAGKINFYCNVVDDVLKHETDYQSIGLILCQDKNTVAAEYALRGFKKPIGVSEYELTRALPQKLKSSLPTVKEIEDELGNKKK